MTPEFELIERHFSGSTVTRDDIVLGIGDDCAIAEIPPGMQLAISADTLVEGRHFVADVDPYSLGHKALAVNLSDLAAMGAEPAWATLCLTLPAADEAWLTSFMRGFSELARHYRVQLIGGDTTRGPLSISVQIHGLVERGTALRRSGAASGDLVYVSGSLGDAGLALLVQQGLYTDSDHLAFLRSRLDRPTPRVELGRVLRAFATSAIDLSDGLAGDLAHVCRASDLGAMLQLDRLPLSPAVQAYVDDTGDWQMPLAAGDDYELAFTVAAERQQDFESALQAIAVPVTWIGLMEKGQGVRVVSPDGMYSDMAGHGYDHFS